MNNTKSKEILEKFESRMVNTTERLKSELNKVRAGRANPHILDKVIVDYYGTPTPLPQMANIAVPEARMLTISLWDISAMKEVNKALMASDIGITPSDDGKIIRLVFPQLTEERRKDLVKNIKKTAEEFKITLRNERRDVIEQLKKLKKDGDLSEDELTTQEKDVQKLTDKYVGQVDQITGAKEKEVLEV